MGLRRGQARVGLVSLKTGETTLLARGFHPRYSRSGHLIAALDGGSIFAQAFDLGNARVSGPLTYIAENVYTSVGGWADYSISETGTLVYMKGRAQAIIEMVDTAGSPRVLPFHIEGAVHFDTPRISPDGERLALAASEEGGHRVYVFDLERGTHLRLTFEGNNEFVGWTPDGDSIAYTVDYTRLAIRAADRSGEESLLLAANEDQIGPFSIGVSHLAFTTQRGPNSDILVAHRDSADSPRVYVATPFSETAPAVSPDGHWLAYVTDETGEQQVYVSSFPAPGGREVVSIGGGIEPAWGRDGQTLYYRKFSGELIAATLRTDDGFAVVSRRTLWTAPYEISPDARDYDVYPDGEHFLMLRSRTLSSKLAVTLNAIENAAKTEP